MGVTIVTKLSAKKVCGKVSPPTTKTPLMEVYGIATDVKTGESNFGPWVALIGRFRATRLSDGEVFQSGVCHLPRMAIELITPLLNADGADSLEFGFSVGVIPAENAFGYEYYVESMLEPSESDPLEMLTKRIGQVSKAALPAPVKTQPAVAEKSKR